MTSTCETVLIRALSCAAVHLRRQPPPTRLVENLRDKPSFFRFAARDIGFARDGVDVKRSPVSRFHMR